MIPRYSRPEMSAIWSPETKFRIWFEIEAHALAAMAEIGAVPKSAAEAVRKKGDAVVFDVARIDEIERETRHDVIAFLTHAAELIGPEARHLHQGMTSSDVLDTCFSVQLTRAADLLLADLDALLAALRRRAFEYKDTATIGRSHGIHAEPTTFGLKLAYAYAEFDRAKSRLLAAREDIATAAISGAVGTFANVHPSIEEYVAKAMGLTPEPISTQIIPRDRHAMFFATLGVIASSMERLATEVRHLQRSEVREAEEFFAPGQKGSSAMPHERDISHSSVERVIGPDATIALDFGLSRLAGLIDRLVVNPERMRANLESLGGVVHSQRVLLALVDKGMSREDAYAAVQQNAMKAWSGEGDFAGLLMRDETVTRYLKPAEIDALFDLAYHLKHVDTIFRRVFGTAEKAPG